ncbi:hypothetical protein ACQP2C_26240 [Micromonospora zamorensis]|uniref:hypothetical protein n=1 Tax=Micromonospora zamorensis TaxID=709883 RepID=UPI003D968BE2
MQIEPTVEFLRAAVDRFVGDAAPDQSWLRLQRQTAPAIDPALAEHRHALLVWLNAWGCRLRYARSGEEDLFDSGLAGWWQRWGAALPPPQTPLAELPRDVLAPLGPAFSELAATRVAAGPRGRSLGPTAASKLLYALRPAALPPWDEAIARALHGRRDGDAYAAHVALNRGWALRLLDEAGLAESELATKLGHPGRSLVKMLDDYCYLVCTRGLGPDNLS